MVERDTMGRLSLTGEGRAASALNSSYLVRGAPSVLFFGATKPDPRR
jgi:hypothetical protein